MVFVTSLYCTGLKKLSAHIAYACSYSLTCQALGLSNRRQHSSDAARLAWRITTRLILHRKPRFGTSYG
jgi:hypothetical protein